MKKNIPDLPTIINSMTRQDFKHIQAFFDSLEEVIMATNLITPPRDESDEEDERASLEVSSIMARLIAGEFFPTLLQEVDE